MKLTMVGTGYVGLVTGACFAAMGNDVVCLDVDQRKIDMLRRGESPIYEPGLSEMLKANIAAGRIRFTLDKAEAYRHAECIFICVGTPSDEDGSADLQYVLAVAKDIADELERIGPGGRTRTADREGVEAAALEGLVLTEARQIAGQQVGIEHAATQDHFGAPCADAETREPYAFNRLSRQGAHGRRESLRAAQCAAEIGRAHV